MAILITGAGLVGTHAAQSLLDQGAQPVLYDAAPALAYIQTITDPSRVPIVRGDIRDLPHLMQVLREHQVDVIVHTAGLIGARVEDEPYSGLQINLGGTINVLEAARVLGVRRVVFATTEGVYDRANAMDVNRRLVETSPYGYNRLYGATKAANELLGHAYVAGWGLDFLVLRLSAVFGPGTFVAGSVAGEFMHALVSAAVERRPLRVRPWSGRREYTYAKDIARAVASACSVQGLRHRIFNVGVGRTYTLDDILAALRRAEPEVDVTVVGEVDQGLARAGRDSPFDTKRAREELGWEAEFELEAAFRDYAAALRRSR